MRVFERQPVLAAERQLRKINRERTFPPKVRASGLVAAYSEVRAPLVAGWKKNDYKGGIRREQ